MTEVSGSAGVQLRTPSDLLVSFSLPCVGVQHSSDIPRSCLFKARCKDPRAEQTSPISNEDLSHRGAVCPGHRKRGRLLQADGSLVERVEICLIHLSCQVNAVRSPSLRDVLRRAGQQCVFETMGPSGQSCADRRQRLQRHRLFHRAAHFPTTLLAPKIDDSAEDPSLCFCALQGWKAAVMASVAKC